MSAAANLILRADAGIDIGAGHIMRCLALAAAWKQSGGRATFVTTTVNDNVLAQIRAAGHSLQCIPCRYPDRADLQATLVAARSGEASWVVLDGYHFDNHYQTAIRQAGFRLLLIDDNRELPMYDADLILNQNLHGAELRYTHPPETRLLLGPEYALLRPEFAEAAAHLPARSGAARRLLVTMGGSDEHNITATVIQALDRLSLAGLQTRVVIGPGNPHRPEIEALLQGVCSRVELITAAQPGAAFHHAPSVPTMAQLMAQADIAISAAGSTCWEMACLGLPALLVVTADNQQRIAESLDRAGTAHYLGRSATLSPTSIASALKSFVADQAGRQGMSELGPRLVDGRGANRVADHLMTHRA